MKRLCCVMLSLVIMLTACLALSPVTVSAKGGETFEWYYGSGNYAAHTFPEIDWVKMDTLGHISINFFKPLDYTNYGYRIYIDSPNQPDWRRVTDVYGGDFYRQPNGTYTANVHLYNSDLYYIFDYSNVNNIRWEGEYDSGTGMYYYPFRVTIRALDAYGNAVGGYRRNAWLTPTWQYEWQGECGLTAPMLVPGGSTSFDSAYSSGRNSTYSSSRHAWHVSNDCLGSAAYNGDCVKVIRIYYKNKSGGWTRLTDVYPNKSYAFTCFSFDISSVRSNSYHGRNCYELTARALDYDGDWISGYLSGATASFTGAGWAMHTNQVR